MLSTIKFRFTINRLFAKRDGIRHDFMAHIHKAQKDGRPQDEIRRLTTEASMEESIINDEIELLTTAHLVDYANRLFIPTPERTDESMWCESSYENRQVLTHKGISILRTAIRAEQKGQREFFVTVLATLIGIIGAITGLVAVFHK